MSRKRKRRKQDREKTPRAQLAIIAGVLLLIGAVLILKIQKPAVGSAGFQDEPQAEAEVGLASPVAATAAPTSPPPTPTLSPEAYLDQSLDAGKPILAFFHSNTCVQCVRMTETVQQVYPDFADTVALVDVNVYDERNRQLLQRAGIRVIPTLIFIDRTGQGQGYTGVMEPEALRAELETLAEE